MKIYSIVIKKKIKYFKKNLTVDGDKSISHRFFLIASQAFGISRAEGILESEDVLCTINALKTLGVIITKKNNKYLVHGNGLGSFKIIKNIKVNCGNSGTLARLLIGLLAPYPSKINLFGDHSLNKRPMTRIMNPLKKIGMDFFPKNKTTLPLTVQGTEIAIPIECDEKIGSAQVKSSIILASLNTPGITKIREFKKSRDHTENMLKYAGVNLKIKKNKKYNLISIKGLRDYRAFNLSVPGDMSSAAFIIAITLLNKKSMIKIKNINLNNTRVGFIKILKKMNAKIKIINQKKKSGEKVGDIIVKSSKLKNINCPKSLVPSTIDEFPILMVLAAGSAGIATFSGLIELNKKESPRLNVMNKILNQIGIKTVLKKDAIKIYGNPDLSLSKSYYINTMFDHRIAMSAFCIGQIFGGKITISDCHSISTSFPGFLKIMKKIGATYEIKKKN
jgi:3-phosphoshikimate 1-carboxyvinyltransferase